MSDHAPRVRTTDLVVEPADDQLLVYDQRTDRAHRLNRTAAIVFRHADGTRTIADLAEVLTAELGEIADEDLVLISLDHLQQADLLDEGPARDATAARQTRRRFIRRVGLVGSAALALPVVHSIVAPTPASAQTFSCGPCGPCGSCTASPQGR
jgi:hypothetical protein